MTIKSGSRVVFIQRYINLMIDVGTLATVVSTRGDGTTAQVKLDGDGGWKELVVLTEDLAEIK